jgi:hypothetical protein
VEYWTRLDILYDDIGLYCRNRFNFGFSLDKESTLGLAQLSHWLSPVKDVSFEVKAIPNLVGFVKR